MEMRRTGCAAAARTAPTARLGGRGPGCAPEASPRVAPVPASAQNTFSGDVKPDAEVSLLSDGTAFLIFSWVYEFLNLQECVLFCKQNTINKRDFPKDTPDIIVREGRSGLQTSMELQRRPLQARATPSSGLRGTQPRMRVAWVPRAGEGAPCGKRVQVMDAAPFPESQPFLTAGLRSPLCYPVFQVACPMLGRPPHFLPACFSPS